MSGSANERIVRDLFAGLSRGDVSPFLAMLAPDAAYRVIGDALGLNSTATGPDGILERIFAPVGLRLAGPLEMDVASVTASENSVAAEIVGRGRLRSGAPYNNRYCFVFRFREGRIESVTEYLDSALTKRAFGVPDDRGDLLERMDLNMWEMWRDIARTARDSTIVETPSAVMTIIPRGMAFHNSVLVRDSIDSEELLARANEVYGSRGLPFSVWLRAHADHRLEQQLLSHGFTQILAMPAMALLGDPGTECAPEELDIRAADDEAALRDYCDVCSRSYATYGMPHELAEDYFARLTSVRAPHVQGFVGYVDGNPVACSALYVTHSVAGVGWVGTVPEARGHRYAEAAVWTTVREGFRRGADFANLQASPMGRTVYERMGFVSPSEYRVLIDSAR